MSKKRDRREKARLRDLEKKGILKEEPVQGAEGEHTKKPQKSSILNKIKYVYENEYKKLVFITLIILVLSLVQIGYQTATTGDFIYKGISLKGGLTITIPDVDYDNVELENHLKDAFPESDLSVRTLVGVGGEKSFIVEADITDAESIKKLESEISDKLGISSESYTTNFVGSSLGSNFFRQVIISMIIAFISMAIVVFIYFRVPIPSLAVILSAFADIVETIAILNIMGVKISTGGVAAILMLIGYSVDTDILLTTRLLKRKEGTVEENIYSSVKTGLMMTITAIAAVVVGIIFAQSDSLKQIMLILLIGLIIDIPNTWIQNAGILKWYLKRKGEKAE